MNIDVAADPAFEFGPFLLLPRRRLLLRDGAPLQLGSRAMDVLLALVERAGELVTRKELESRAWPGLCVEDTSLRVHVHALRRRLEDGLSGARYIANVPARGYCFVAPVARTAVPLPAAETASRAVSAPNAAIDNGGVQPPGVAERVRPALQALAGCLADLCRLEGSGQVPSALSEAMGRVDAANELLASALRLLAVPAPAARALPERVH